uniref:Putative da-p36 protein n=1 Tax=Rhipicephalus pulchellus TaxID=72859 RepID=L7LR11_RHIPC
MELTIILGLISLIIIPIEANPGSRKGRCQKVNLTEVAEKHVLRRAEGLKELIFVGGDGKNKSVPLHVAVGEMLYEDGCTPNYTYDFRKCKGLYMWFMNCSIYAPLYMPANVTVPYQNKENHTFTFNISGAATKEWNPGDMNKTEYSTGNTTGTSCNFTVPVTFTGMLHYWVEKTRGDFPHKNTIGIGYLASHDEGLYRRSDNELSYNISGIFKHEVICPNEEENRQKISKSGGKSKK